MFKVSTPISLVSYHILFVGSTVLWGKYMYIHKVLFYTILHFTKLTWLYLFIHHHYVSVGCYGFLITALVQILSLFRCWLRAQFFFQLCCYWVSSMSSTEFYLCLFNFDPWLIINLSIDLFSIHGQLYGYLWLLTVRSYFTRIDSPIENIAMINGEVLAHYQPSSIPYSTAATTAIYILITLVMVINHLKSIQLWLCAFIC